MRLALLGRKMLRRDAIDAKTTNAEVDAATKLGLDGMNDSTQVPDTKSGCQGSHRCSRKAKIEALRRAPDLNDADGRASAIAEVEELACEFSRCHRPSRCRLKFKHC